MPQFNLFLLGHTRLERDGVAQEFDTRKALALLAYLAVTGESHSRDWLAAFFWPEYDQSRARAALRRTLSVLKSALDGHNLTADRETIALDRGDGFRIDMLEFQASLAECRTHGHAAEEVCLACLPKLTQAVTLYRADFMAGFTLRDSPEFDDWQYFQSESLRRELADGLEKLVTGYSRQGEYRLAIGYARRWLALDPLHEPAHRELLQLYHWSGQRQAALRQHQEFVRLLEQELGVSPDSETTILYQAIKQNNLPAPVIQATEPAAVSLPKQDETAARNGQEPDHTLESATNSPITTPGPLFTMPAGSLHNLPAQITAFVGRDAELNELKQRLTDPACHLVTLVGPGGMGKTRLGLQVAQAFRAENRFSHGIFLVSLAAVDSPDLLVSSIARVLGLNFYGTEPAEVQLANYLREKQMLLMLDNFEHLLAGADQLKYLIEQAPRIKLLVTSQERLNLQAEWVLELSGLQVPKADVIQSAEAYSALALFIQHATQIQANFRPTAEEYRDIIRICELVEGMPLGIELAAAWVRLLSCAEIAQEIERNLDFLAVSSRDLPARHHSLRAAFDHAWNLLTADERKMLARLAVFRGGFGREAALHVTESTLRSLSVLVDKSLLRRTANKRYHLHESIRKYAIAQLEDDPQEYITTRNRHSYYYLTWLADHEQLLKSAAQHATMGSVRLEIENIRQAWYWAAAYHQVSELQRAVPAVFWLHEMNSWFLDGITLFQQAREILGLPDEVSPADLSPEYQLLQGRLLAAEGYFSLRYGRFERAQTILPLSLAILRSLDAPLALADALAHTGALYHFQGHYYQAKQLLYESLSLRQAKRDAWGRGRCLLHLGLVARNEGDYAEAYNHIQAALTCMRQAGDPLSQAHILAFLSFIANNLGRHVEAQQLAQESLIFSHTHGHRWGMAKALVELGTAARALGRNEDDEALYLFQEGLVIFRELGEQWDIIYTLNCLGQVMYDRGEDNAARQYFTEAINTAVDARAWPMAMYSLAGLAMILARLAYPEAALEIAGYVLNDPTGNQEAKQLAKKLWTELETKVPQPDLEALHLRNQGKTPEMLIAGLPFS